MSKYEFDYAQITIRRFQQAAEGEKPATDRMVFSFKNELGQQVLCRGPIAAANSELDRYVEERVQERMAALAPAANKLLSELRGAAEQAIAANVALKGTFPNVVAQLEAVVDEHANKHIADQKAARTRATNAVTEFAARIKEVVPGATTATTPVATIATPSPAPTA